MTVVSILSVFYVVTRSAMLQKPHGQILDCDRWFVQKPEARGMHTGSAAPRHRSAVPAHWLPRLTKDANASPKSLCQRESGGRFSTMSPAAHKMRFSSSARVASLSGQRI